MTDKDLAPENNVRMEQYSDGVFRLWRLVRDTDRSVVAFGFLTRGEAHRWAEANGSKVEP